MLDPNVISALQSLCHVMKSTSSTKFALCSQLLSEGLSTCKAGSKSRLSQCTATRLLKTMQIEGKERKGGPNTSSHPPQ
jgi:hypothetical protein